MISGMAAMEFYDLCDILKDPVSYLDSSIESYFIAYKLTLMTGLAAIFCYGTFT